MIGQDENKIVIPLSNGYSIYIEQNSDPDYNREVFVGITDPDGVWWQDLVVVRNAYHYKGNDVVYHDNEFEVLVYSDKDDPDYTHRFAIDLYQREEESR